ncbi:hypothetical protein AN639_05475 [Candidatus Epulonipiscium fishelsonii]|uniref:Uncharacterized protein n=1 Tax=Candidatus Epulonipiscium fishelsonii TaxID=77094 RepID=A0ACC8XAL1_9FIRM|nr:hypothetical protein AN396_08370 [Epulopiscium sp. SCG-B11WGA-EpuloA1]ONI40155.1 hypothetical protein AN639_05475 [Epulopiscium sp. SCG-B05WGA-EpuloA1]
MKIRKNLIMLVVLLCTLSLIGCSQTSSEVVEYQEQVASLENQLSLEQQKNKELQTKITTLESALKKYQQVDDTYSLLKVYTVDANTMETLVLDELFPQDNIINTLDTLANSLSQNVFENLGIEILSIEDIDGQKIAHIDLQDDATIPVTWNSFFQGSTGGKITTDSLKMTFLQSNYPSEWIDGISFTYKGEPITGDHVEELTKIIYR